MKIALDAMGHDSGPAPLIEGAALALTEFRDIEKLILTGDESRLKAELQRLGCNDSRIEILHCTQVVEMGDSATDAIRKKRDSSISRAVELVKSGGADAVVSAGHTGAAVAACQIRLRTLAGIERPGIAATLPTQTNLFVLIDAGANPDPSPKQILQNAIMGAVYSRHVLGRENPEVGLMSIGTEDEKGNDFTRESFELLKASGLNFRGNIEGHDLFENPVDVVVADGFTGNVVLKTVEAIAHAIFRWLKTEITKTPIRKLGGLLARDAFRAIHKRTDADEYGGMPLLGVNGVCIIAHGGSSPRAIKNAIRQARETINHRVNPHIIEAAQSYESAAATHQNPPA